MMSETEVTDHGPRSGTDGADLRHHGDRIEQLLEEIRGMAGPSTWQRVEELLRLVVELYGAGMGGVLHHVSEAGALSPELTARLCGDQLVSSLLLLHGLHPFPTAERVARAVETFGQRTGAPIELLAIADGAIVRLRVGQLRGGCGPSRAALLATLRDAIAEAAPEISRVEVEGEGEVERGPTESRPAATHATGAGGRLVTIGLPRGRG